MPRSGVVPVEITAGGVAAEGLMTHDSAQKNLVATAALRV